MRCQNPLFSPNKYNVIFKERTLSNIAGSRKNTILTRVRKRKCDNKQKLVFHLTVLTKVKKSISLILLIILDASHLTFENINLVQLHTKSSGWHKLVFRKVKA